MIPGVVWAVVDELLSTCDQMTSEELVTCAHEAAEQLQRDLRIRLHTAVRCHHQRKQ